MLAEAHPPLVEIGTAYGAYPLIGQAILEAKMTDPKTKDEPSEELEEKVRKNPENEELQVTLGSDESMDASDPIASTQPGANRGDPVVGDEEE